MSEDISTNINLNNLTDYKSTEIVSSVNEVPILFLPWITWVWTVIIVALLVLGLCGNCLVVAVVARTRDLRSSTNLLLVNLAGADLLVLLVPLPTSLIELHSPPEIWLLGEEMCKIVPFVEWAVSHASVLTIMVIGTERYYAICRPLIASYTITRVRALGCIILIWIAAITVSLPNIFVSVLIYVPYAGKDQLVPTCFNNMSTDWGKIYYTVMIGALFFLPLALLLVLYIFICRKLIKDKHSYDLQRKSDQDTVMKARRQVVFMIAIVTTVFFVCLLPFRVYSLWLIWEPNNGKDLGPTKFYSILYITRILLYLNSSINPVLYSLSSSKFREAFVKLIHPGRTLLMARTSTLTNTGTSQCNGRITSSKSIIVLEPFTSVSAQNSIKHINLQKEQECSLNEFSEVSKNIYGRKSSFNRQHLNGTNPKLTSVAKEDSVRSNSNDIRSKLECVKELK